MEKTTTVTVKMSPTQKRLQLQPQLSLSLTQTVTLIARNLPGRATAKFWMHAIGMAKMITATAMSNQKQRHLQKRIQAAQRQRSPIAL
jgi:hypothetical protein